MFKKVRRKFILTAVCSVVLVVACIIATINIVNYTEIVGDADDAISALMSGLPARYGETRYFTVTLFGDGTVIADVSHMISVSPEEAAAYAAQVIAGGSAGGFTGSLRYGVSAAHGRTTCVFVDCSIELGNFYDFLTTSIIIGVIAVAVVFALIFVFSGRIMKPVAESYGKQKQFITDAGHELKTPLTIIGANTELIEIQTGESEWTRGIKEQIKRLSSLTEELIFLARMEENADIKLSSFDLSEAVNATVQSFSAVAAGRGIQIESDVEAGLTLIGNREMICRLCNLLTDNALKYTDGQKVCVSLRAEGNKKVLSVRNAASYMEDGDLGYLFERFTRGDGSRNSATGGHGIGLSVARAIVQTHKGKIRAECRKGEVTFTVIL